MDESKLNVEVRETATDGWLHLHGGIKQLSLFLLAPVLLFL